MTTFLLIRHGDNDAIGQIMAGWTPEWHLNARGKQQAERLAQRLAARPIRAIYTSPLERAVETAEPIARQHGLELQQVEALGEIRLGEWEGRPIAELDRREDWRKFNAFRSGTRAPGGELMIETQTRMVQQITSLCERHPDDTIAVVSHADPLRAVIAYFLGMPLDLVQRLEIGPASLSVLQVHGWGARVLSLNETEN
jgi:probable phosphomutase (TIGR03848 family)